MHAENLIASRVQHLMDMPKKPHSHDHAAMYGIQYSAKPWISETPYDRDANHDVNDDLATEEDSGAWDRGNMRSSAPETYPNPVTEAFLGHVEIGRAHV